MDERTGDRSEPGRSGNDAGDKTWWPGQQEVIRTRTPRGLMLPQGAGLGSQATGSGGGGGAQGRAGGWVGRGEFYWDMFLSGALDCGDLPACEGTQSAAPEQHWALTVQFKPHPAVG